MDARGADAAEEEFPTGPPIPRKQYIHVRGKTLEVQVPPRTFVGPKRAPLPSMQQTSVVRAQREKERQRKAKVSGSGSADQVDADRNVSRSSRTRTRLQRRSALRIKSLQSLAEMMSWMCRRTRRPTSRRRCTWTRTLQRTRACYPGWPGARFKTITVDPSTKTKPSTRTGSPPSSPW